MPNNPVKQKPVIDIRDDEIKEEGRAGLHYAENEKRVLVSAWDAIPGAPYLCKFCSCPMHLTHLKNGKPIFARNKNQMHNHAICRNIESLGVEHTFAELEPTGFFRALCRKPIPRGPRGPEGGEKNGTGGPKNTHGPHIDVPDDNNGIRPFSSLKQIADAGIYNFRANDRYGTHCVSDYLLTFQYAPDLFMNTSFYLGGRIIHARYAYSSSERQTLYFYMFNSEREFNVRFSLYFPNKGEYKRYREKFETYKEDEQGRTRPVLKHRIQEVLVVSENWIPLTKDQCGALRCAESTYCDSCQGMYGAVFTSKNQIYLIPSDN